MRSAWAGAGTFALLAGSFFEFDLTDSTLSDSFVLRDEWDEPFMRGRRVR